MYVIFGRGADYSFSFFPSFFPLLSFLIHFIYFLYFPSFFPLLSFLIHFIPFLSLFFFYFYHEHICYRFLRNR